MSVVAIEDCRRQGAGLSDAELVARARAGDAEAYSQIYERHHRAVVAVVRSRLGRQGEASDTVQEVFTAAWRNLDGLRDPSRLRAWLVQIARREAAHEGRRFRRTTVEAFEDLLVPLADTGPVPEELAELSDLAASLAAGLRGLNARDARALRLAVHSGLGPTEMAVALGVTPGNAKVILHRARRRLRATAAL